MTPVQLRKRIAVGFIGVLLVVVLYGVLYRIPQGNERLIAEIQRSLGSSTVSDCIIALKQQRDPALFPLLNREPFYDFVSENSLDPVAPRVPFQFFTDRYGAIWSLTKEAGAGTSRELTRENPVGVQPRALKLDLEGMIQMSSPRSGDLSLAERLEWARKSLECIESYLGTGRLVDEEMRLSLIHRWLSMSRFHFRDIENPDQLRQLATAINSIEPPLTGFRKALTMEYVSFLEDAQQSINTWPEGAISHFLGGPDLSYALSRLKARTINLDEWIKPLDRPWYAHRWSMKWMNTWGLQIVPMMMSRDLAAGIEFFHEAIGFRIAQLEGGELPTTLTHSRVETTSRGEVWVIWDGDPPQHHQTDHLFDPYRFPQ